MRNIKLFEDATEGAKDKSKKGEGKTPFLDVFGKDLTQMAKDNKLSPVFGREKEVYQVLLVLSRKTKNNPVIIGEPGVGKTALVEGLAQVINNGKCPRILRNKRIIYVDMGSLMAGASQQGEFEKRMKALLKELENNPNVILFIDEIHLMTNDQMPIDAANMFKPALARGDMRLIGATTLNEFRNSIEKDGALERRFQKVLVEETNVEDTIKILNKIKSKFEEYHLVKYSDESIQACVKLSDEYITNRFFPDKAIDMLDEVGARARLSSSQEDPPEIEEMSKKVLELKDRKNELTRTQKYEEASGVRADEVKAQEELARLRKEFDDNVEHVTVTKDDVAQIISLRTGIPAHEFSKDEGEKLLKMKDELNMQIIGQSNAVAKITKCIKRNRTGLKDKNRPNGVFLFLGSTGVGKTHTVKTLAKYLFGDADAMIRVDMSEYAEKHNVARMIGSPPGYVGYGEGGQLTEKVRRKPYSVILFDELEKAHPNVLNIMLQIFDDGKLTDGQGRVVNFKNTIIIMTSNIGTSEIKNLRPAVGFSTTEKETPEEQVKDLLLKELHKQLPPEFINRIDDVIVFEQLEKDNIYKIIDIEIKKLAKKLENMGFTLTITDAVKDLLIEHGYDQKMGARPLKRAIQNHLEDPIADELLRKNIQDAVAIDYDPKTKELTINGNVIQEGFKYLNKFFLTLETKFSNFKA